MEDEIDLSEGLDILKKNWIWALIGFIVIFASIAAYTFLINPVYQAKTFVIVSSQDQNTLLLSGVASRVTNLETQRIIILSPSVMNDVYLKYGQEFKVSAAVIKNSEIIEITVESDNPETSAGAANSIAESYINYNRETKEQEANNVIDFVTMQIEDYNDESAILDARLLSYASLGENMSMSEKLEYQNIQREIAAKNRIYDYLLTKKEEAGLAASLKNANVKIVSYAEIPLKPVKPNIFLNMILGVLLGIGAGVSLAFMAERKTKKPVNSYRK